MRAKSWVRLLIPIVLAAAFLPISASASQPHQQTPWSAYEGNPPAGQPPGGGQNRTDTPIAWIPQAPSPIPHMDSAVAWAVQDGGLWVVGGIFTGGATQRYDPTTGFWSLGAIQPMPAIQEPTDGCYGLNAQGNEVIVLFPDATGTVVGLLQIYDVTANAWYQIPTPPGFPAAGQWASDIVSMYSVTSQNLCYLSGGATAAWPGGGNLSSLWQYNPATNTIVLLGNYTHIPGGFNWHTSWYVPWVGAAGGICVAGGVDFNLGLWPTTQCYDLAAGVFLPPNVPLGPLPIPLGGAADGWKIDGPLFQIWLANGLDPALNHWNLSAWADPTTPLFVVGPPMAAPTYRTEGDDWNGHLYAEGGSFLLFNPQPHNQFLVQDPYLGTCHVGNIKMSWIYGSNPGTFKITTKVLVHDQNGVRLPGVLVSATMTYPDGTVKSMTSTSGLQGTATFINNSKQVGKHTFCVTNMTKPGYVYYPAQNRITCRNLQVGP